MQGWERVVFSQDDRMADLNWAAANGGVTNGGLRSVWPPFLEIGRNRPFSPFFCLFRPFPEGTNSTWEIQKTEEKGLFPQISSDLLKPPSLKPPFAAPQLKQFTASFGRKQLWLRFHQTQQFSANNSQKQRPVLDLVSQTPAPNRGRAPFADNGSFLSVIEIFCLQLCFFFGTEK